MLSILAMPRQVPDPPKRLHELSFVLATSSISKLAGGNFRPNFDQAAYAAVDVAEVGWRVVLVSAPCPASEWDDDPAGAGRLDAAFDRIVGDWLLTHAPIGPLALAIAGNLLKGVWLDEHDQSTPLSAMIHQEGPAVGSRGFRQVPMRSPRSGRCWTSCRPGTGYA